MLSDFLMCVTPTGLIPPAWYGWATDVGVTAPSLPPSPLPRPRSGLLAVQL